jgi:hypothetical protein
MSLIQKSKMEETDDSRQDLVMEETDVSDRHSEMEETDVSNRNSVMEEIAVPKRESLMEDTGVPDRESTMKKIDVPSRCDRCGGIQYHPRLVCRCYETVLGLWMDLSTASPLSLQEQRQARLRGRRLRCVDYWHHSYTEGATGGLTLKRSRKHSVHPFSTEYSCPARCERLGG